jgi:hypothetical protein
VLVQTTLQPILRFAAKLQFCGSRLSELNAKGTTATLLAFVLLLIAPCASACEISCSLGQTDGPSCHPEGAARVEAAGFCAHHVHAFGKRTVERAPMSSAAAFQSFSNHLAWSGLPCMNSPCHQGRASVEPSSSRSVSPSLLLPASLFGATTSVAQTHAGQPLSQNRNRKLSGHNLDPLVSVLRI